MPHVLEIKHVSDVLMDIILLNKLIVLQENAKLVIHLVKPALKTHMFVLLVLHHTILKVQAVFQFIKLLLE